MALRILHSQLLQPGPWSSRQPGHQLGSVLCVSFSALTDVHPAHEEPVPLISKDTLQEEVEEENRG